MIRNITTPFQGAFRAAPTILVNALEPVPDFSSVCLAWQGETACCNVADMYSPNISTNSLNAMIYPLDDSIIHQYNLT